MVQIDRATAAGESYLLQFQLRNPATGQQSPVPILAGVWPPARPASPIDATLPGPWAISPVSMDADPNPPLNIPGARAGDAAPLRVYSPGFPVASIGQNAPFPGLANTITVTLSSNFNLSASAGSRVTLSGLVGSATPDSQALYLAGGFDGKAFFNDVHVSPNGLDWTPVTAAAAWSAREGHALVSQNQSLYVIAGRTLSAQSQNTYLSDVWASVDGISWSLAAAAAAFTPRAYFGVVALGPLPSSGLLIYGGATNNPALRLNDVWRSNDGGQTWAQVVASAPWAARYGLVTLPFLVPASPPGGLFSLYSDSAALPSVLVAAGSTCSAGCGQYDLTLPGCAVLSGPMQQCCVRTDPCVTLSNLADLWASFDSGKTWVPVGGAAPYAPRAFSAAAALPDGTAVLASGYDYWDHFTPDLQLLSISAALDGNAQGAQWRAVPVGAPGVSALRRAGGQMVAVKGCLVLLGGYSRRDANVYTYYGDSWTSG